MRVLIVIVNYRTAELTIDCLRSLAPQVDEVSARVVVADNRSSDGSVEKLRAAIADHGWTWVELVESERNGGFAYGNNVAIAHALRSGARPEYVYLLNPDTIALPGALRELVAFLDAHAHVGIAGSAVLNRDGSVRTSTFRFPSVLSELDDGMRLGLVSRLVRRRVVAIPPPAHPVKVDWVSGASLIARRSVLEEVGLLDERYFMYYEETDFCLRAARAGWPCWYVPSSRIVHLVGQSSGVTGEQQVARRRPAYWFESRNRYFRLRHGTLSALAADAVWVAGYSVHTLVRNARRRRRTDPPWLLWDFIRHGVTSWTRDLS